MHDERAAWREELIHSARSGPAISRRVQPFPAQAVLIVGGSCRDESGVAWKNFIRRLEAKLTGFCGRVISGGTRAGVCREIGRISAERPCSQRGWTSVGYLPRCTPPSLIDDRYDEQVFTDGATFSEIEPLQYWSDILASGITPGEVTFLRYGGGDLSDFEARLAEALGAKCISVADAVNLTQS
jgi:hypothetical protein